VFVPGLGVAWAFLWPALVLGAVAAVVLVLRRPAAGQMRALAAVGVMGLLAYVVTPTTAFGTSDRPVLFAENTRYALPAMAVLLMLLVRAVSPRARAALGAGVLVTLIVTLVPWGSFPTLLPGHEGRALACGAIALALALVVSQRRLTAAVLVVLALPVLFVVGRGYERDRYTSTAHPESVAFSWADTVHGAHLGLSGVMQAYPFVGTDITNRVDHIGLHDADRVFVVPPTCAEWRRAVARGGYDYVVLGPVYLKGETRFADSWLDASAMTKVLTAPPYRVYRVVSRPDPATCP
jgi:hypothetical protein